MPLAKAASRGQKVVESDADDEGESSVAPRSNASSSSKTSSKVSHKDRIIQNRVGANIRSLSRVQARRSVVGAEKGARPKLIM